MAERYRLNLEAPFLNAAADPMQPRPSASADATGFQRPANDVSTPAATRSFVVEKHLRRLPAPQRGQADYAGETMARYINGLEARLIDHIRQHAPRWHDAETGRALRRWSIPAANHPAPSWATPRDTLTQARDYAGELVRERIVARMRRVHDIRIARTLGGYGEVDPLHLLFHKRSAEPARKIKPKM